MPEEFETLPNGARQSKVETRMDLLPPRAMLALSSVLCEGAAKYGDCNWHGIPAKSHLNHMLRHVFLWLKGDTSEDHLGHMLCRAAMLYERAAMDQEMPRLESVAEAVLTPHEPLPKKVAFSFVGVPFKSNRRKASAKKP